MIIGAAGIGKTTLARAAVARFGDRFDRVDWVTATTPTAAIPFAAFSHLIDVPDTGKTAEVLRTARATLGDGRLLVVDDAHLLDNLSAALVYQLAVSGAASLIVTVAPDGSVSEEISALWEDDLLNRLELEPPGHVESRLTAMVDEFVSALPASAHRVLEYLAVDDPLPLAEVADVDADGVTATRPCRAGQRTHRRHVAAAGDQRPAAFGDRRTDLFGEREEFRMRRSRRAIDAHRPFAARVCGVFTGHEHNLVNVAIDSGRAS